ncbi:hypothetical protein B0H17DRAFT_908559, partial [Mycena rosella]
LFIALATNIAAICPGFNFGIGNKQKDTCKVNGWNVYDDKCKKVNHLTTTGNPCDKGIFGCTPKPI